MGLFDLRPTTASIIQQQKTTDSQMCAREQKETQDVHCLRLVFTFNRLSNQLAQLILSSKGAFDF